MDTHPGLLLERHGLRLVVAPGQGAAIQSFTWNGVDVLRPAPGGGGADAFASACFALVPYVNRIANGRFDYRGRAVHLARNWSGSAHPLHGQGWCAPWAVDATTRSSAVLRFDGGADEWPWRYACEQRIELTASGLLITLSLANLSQEPMPAQLGLHPYFPQAAAAQLRARLPRVWLTDAAALPVEATRTPVAFGFEPARPVQAVPLDHCFGGWNGIAALGWPDRGLTLRASGCPWLHVYAPAGCDFFCLEPQSGAAGALVRGGAEVFALAPGARTRISMELTVGGA